MGAEALPIHRRPRRKPKAKGKYKGRPKSISPAPILELLNGGLSMRKTADQLGISLSTVQRVKIESFAVMDEALNETDRKAQMLRRPRYSENKM